MGEPAADLGIALAIVSSFRDEPLKPDVAAVGEVGLSGEVRGVTQLDRRVMEVARLGLDRCLVPARSSEHLDGPRSLETVPVDNLAAAVNACVPRR